MTPIDLTPVASEIFDRPPASSPWLPSRAVIELAIELLPSIEDDLLADLVELLVMTLVDRDEELQAVRAVLASALELSFTQRGEIKRLKQRLGDLLDAQRRERRAA